MGGYIMQLQHFSVNDGEGIRTIIFMAGCPLRCAWCANPEGQTLQNPMTRWVETEEILREMRRQAIFYRFSGGGVTFSGGEATAQPAFLGELADALYDEGFDLAIETCGQFDFDALAETLKKMELIFIDLKHIDPAQHRRFTGVDNRLILENIQRTGELGVPTVVRIPVILGVNADDDSMSRAFAFLRAQAPHASLELLPYHRFGEEKYKELGMPPPDAGFGIPTSEQLSHWQDMARSMGIDVASYL
ncbi:MAG: glycyl-radical enzyme activating protein [Clostridia bacterium]|nr:glycyl-radical enzyme activating protein [Clostridia bacterium]